MSLPNASDEQKIIVNELINGNNVVVDAVAGSGKTTTIFHLAKACTDKKILVLTYNRALRLESVRRARKLGLNNLDIHTYHSSAVNLYNVESLSSYDSTLRKIIAGSCSNSGKYYDIIVLDEIQDMTELLYLYSKKVISDNSDKSLLMILGDKYQCIYRYRGANPDYIQDPIKYFNRSFKPCSLHTSYRITSDMADFVNDVIGFKRIHSANDNCDRPVILKTGDPFNCNFVATWVLDKLEQGYKPDDIFILNQSIKHKGNEKPIHKLANILSQHNIPIYRPLDDNDELNDENLKGKLVVSTFHQTKGRERKIVLCFGFDERYFQFSGQMKDISNGTIDPYRCPNEWYVALTRAKKFLFVISGYTLPPWVDSLPRCKLLGPDPKICCELKDKQTNFTRSVRELVAHLPSHLDEQIINCFQEITLPDCETIDIDKNIKCNGHNEPISDLTGVAITSLFEAHCSNKSRPSSIYKLLLASECLPKHLQQWSNNENYMLELSANYEAMTSGYINRLNQITRYDWLKPIHVQSAFNNIKKYINKVPYSFEYPCVKVFESIEGEIQIKGLIDAVTDDTVWEFKCTSDIKPDHLAQLLLYAWLTDYKHQYYKILNIQNGTCYQLTKDLRCIELIVKEIVESNSTCKSSEGNGNGNGNLNFNSSTLFVSEPEFDDLLL